MTRASFAVLRGGLPLAALLPLLLTWGCGGGTAVTTPVVTPTTIAITPPAAAIVFGALGRTVQLNVTGTSSAGVTATNANVTWTSSVASVASVSGTGLVTAVTPGSASITAVFSGVTSGAIPIVVAQVAATITVASTNITFDTLVTATRTRQFSAVAKDSTNNVLPAPTFAWSSSAPSVASVGAASGLVSSGTTAGIATITAAIGAISGTRAMVVRHYPATFTISPTSASIATNGGTQLFTGTSQDSVGTNVPITWLSLAPAIATVSPATGTSTTAAAAGNGTTYIVLTSGVRADSAALAVSNQGFAATVAVSVGNFFFKSGRNLTVPAVDTLGVGGTATWTWASGTHFVQSTGSPAFANGGTINGAGQTSVFTFGSVGTYSYICGIHGASMSGTIVVR